MGLGLKSSRCSASRKYEHSDQILVSVRFRIGFLWPQSDAFIYREEEIRSVGER